MMLSMADRVEGLLYLLCEELWEEEDQVRLLACQSRVPEAGFSVPLQYLLCVLDLPQARRILLATLPAWREALDKLEVLIRHVDAVWAEDGRGWAPFTALLTAPFPVRRPAQPDLRDADVLLVLERDARFGGSWEGLLEWLHEQGSRKYQATIQRVRQLAAFEQQYGVNLRDLLSSEPATHDQPPDQPTS